MRSRGGMVAVDDAGAGYASLAHILELRPDFVKLDRALIAAVHLDDAKAALVEMFGAARPHATSQGTTGACCDWSA